LDPFRPVLKAGTPSLRVTAEQDLYIREILDICCSDSASAKKAYAAIEYVLTNNTPGPVPALTSLTPATTVVAVPVPVVVAGTGFFVDSVVQVNGVAVPTTFVSDTELGFSPDVSVAGTLAVTVLNTDLQVSNSVNFDVTAV